jgi:carboxyl-terminal processing protease
MRFRIGTQGSLVCILGVAVVGSTLAVTRSNDYAFFDPLLEVKGLLSQRFVEEPDTKAMQLAAIKGMVDALEDPYTVFVPSAETKEFEKELTGDFVGIGVQIVIRDGWLTVVTPLEDSPAFAAGVMAEDRIVEIAGKSTFGLSSSACIELLSGEPGTKVDLVVERSGEKIPMTVERQRIIARTVKGFHWQSEADSGSKGAWQYFIDPQRKIAYLRLTQFTPTTGAEFADAIRAMGAADGNVNGLILDLRWNPGGVLQEAIKIADLFLKEGVIVSTRGRAHAEEITRATADGTLPDFPIAALINGGSASASEVLSGALTENNRAITVGTRTFGKGLVQGVMTLPSGVGQLKVTEQRYYLPSGRSLQREEDSADWGVDPTQGFYIAMTDEEAEAMIEARGRADILKAGKPDETWANPDQILATLKDKQLAAALTAVQKRLDSASSGPGEWTPTGEELPKGNTLASADLTRAQKLRDRMERELIKLDRRIESLQTASADAAPAAKDLWPDSAEVTGGYLDVFDKDGKKVARLRITGDDVERWLLDASVKKEDE